MSKEEGKYRAGSQQIFCSRLSHLTVICAQVLTRGVVSVLSTNQEDEIFYR